MLFMHVRESLSTVMVATALLLTASSRGVATSAVPPAEVRGLWVPRTAMTTATGIATLVTDARNAGITDLLVQVRGRGEAFYTSDLEPRASELDGQPAAFDPLALTIERARAAGLKVHAWINVNLVASGTTLPRASSHVAARHPEWLMVPRPLAASIGGMAPRSPGYIGTLARWTRAASGQVEGLYLSPLHAEARAYSVSLVRELVERYAVDGVHFDYVRYPSDEFDYSAGALAAFRASRLSATSMADRHRLDLASKSEAAAWTTAQPAAWAAFRRDQLTLLIAGLQAAARATRPGIVVSAAVVPDAADARDRKFQEWPVWARASYFDVLCPMIYTSNADDFDATLQTLPAMLGGTPFWAGIGAYRLPVSGTIEHLRLARRSDAAGIVLFSYEKLAERGDSADLLSAFRSALLASQTPITRRSPAP